MKNIVSCFGIGFSDSVLSEKSWLGNLSPVRKSSKLTLDQPKFQRGQGHHRPELGPLLHLIHLFA